MNLASTLRGVIGRFIGRKPTAFTDADAASIGAGAHFANPANWTDTPASSWVRSLAYYYDISKGGSRGTLRVRYKSGAVCEYGDVPLATWTGFLTAASKGKFVHAHLFDKPYTLVS